jgi:N6-adenosine-specific RNA methylase IME4
LSTAISISQPRELALLSQSVQLLAEAKSLDEVKEIRDKAAALQYYLRQQGEGLEAQNTAAEIRLRAERRAGELLAEMPKHDGNPRLHDATRLADLGIEKTQSHRWQRIASLPSDDFEAHIGRTKERGHELTTAGVLKLARKVQAAAAVVDSVPVDDSAGSVVGSLQDLITAGQRFACIYADPPWRYGNQGTRAATDTHYPTMTVEQICAEPVAAVAAENAHLHLWVAAGFLPEAFRVIEAWGFEYRSYYVWNKPQLGLGNYWRMGAELLLLGVRGSLGFRTHDEPNWGVFDRREHSRKPDEIRAKVEAGSPGPYLEMYARIATPGWTAYGNQIARREAS